MGFLTPLALAFAALGIPILIFYMLKLKREAHVVSSTYLWQQVLQDREANAPWQKLRRNLLLLLQLLLLALLVFALARPFSQIEQAFQGNAVILLDASASMQATDGGGAGRTRFQVAVERAQTLIDGLGPNDTMTLIAVADTPRVLASLTNDKSVLRQALNAARVSSAEADWEGALILAASSAQANVKNTVIILSDGGLAADVGQAVPGQLSYVPTGVTAENIAIAALAVRDGPNGPQAFVRVVNYGTQPARPLVQVYVDEVLFDARTLDLAPGQEGGIALDDLPLGAETVEARLPVDGKPVDGKLVDALAIDNTAWAVRTPGEQAAIMLVTPGSTFLERALGLLPNLNMTTIRVTETLTNAVIAQPALPPALTIFDRITPAQLPEGGNLLFIAPPTSTDLFRLTGVLSNTQITNVKRDHALLSYVDLSDVRVSRALRIEAAWAAPLVETADGALLLAGNAGSRRVAILTFELHQSDLPLKIAFPILIANLTQWLAPTGSIDLPEQLAPGQPVLIRPQMGVDQVVVIAPSGQQWTFPVEAGDIPFAQTQEPGIYTVEQRRGDETLRARFAVNLFSELESDITPRDELQIGEAPVAVQKPAGVGRREWWRWPALAALGILVIEWFAHHRGKLPVSLWGAIRQKLNSKRKQETNPFD